MTVVVNGAFLTTAPELYIEPARRLGVVSLDRTLL